MLKSNRGLIEEWALLSTSNACFGLGQMIGGTVNLLSIFWKKGC